MEDSNARKEIRRLLWRWGRVAVTCARKQKELQDYLDLIQSVSDVHSSPLTGMPGSGRVSDNTARAAEKLIFLEGQYQTLIDILTKEIEAEIRFRIDMDQVLQHVEDPARTIVDMRYKYGWTFDKIARETSYSEASVKRLDGIAVNIVHKYVAVEKVDTK